MGYTKNIRYVIRVIFVSLCCMVYTPCALLGQTQEQCSKPLANMIAKVVPAVVNISSTQKAKKQQNSALQEYFETPEDLFRFFFKLPLDPRAQRKTYSLGSGFVISADGYIVTNYHVVDGADEINVTFDSNSRRGVYKAVVIGKDLKTDLAVLKITPKNKIPLPFLNFADSTQVRVGDAVVAVGNPFGLGGTVTAGIISAKGRHIEGSGYDEFLQTDAAINSGNSGGPLCDVNGDVVGVNSAILSPSGGNVGIGFASSSHMILPVIKQLKDTGVVKRGWLGVFVQNVDDNIADSLGIGDARGALVLAVSPNSPASKANILVGDAILSYNSVVVRDMSHLVHLVNDTPIGSQVIISVLRNDKNIQLTAVITKQENTDESIGGGAGAHTNSNVVGSDFLGVVVSDILLDVRRNFNIDSSETGVVVVEVKQDGPAALSDINVGDIIKSINQKAVKNSKDFITVINEIKKQKRRATLLFIMKPGVGNVFIGLPNSAVK